MPRLNPEMARAMEDESGADVCPMCGEDWRDHESDDACVERML